MRQKKYRYSGDPVEYNLEGITQGHLILMQVLRLKREFVRYCARSRYSYVGEVRDKQTAPRGYRGCAYWACGLEYIAYQ